MAFLAWLRKVLLNENDGLASYRDRIVMPASLVAIVLVTPFGINNLLQGRIALALAISVVVVALAVNVAALRRGRRVPVHYGFVVLPIIVGMVASVSQQGIYGALWSYAVVLICYFVLSRRLAFIFTVAILVAMPGAVAAWVDPALAVRLFATLLLTIALINLVLNVIGELQDALVRQAITDPLTGAFNRRHMRDSLELVVEQGRRHVPNNALLLLDVDHFKAINDQHGHDVGDRVLRQLVQAVTARKRKTDGLFRLGGEEFVLLLIETDTDGAASVSEDLRRLVECAPMIEGRAVTISIGIAQQRAGESADDWLRRADQAMYRAKQLGRNRVELDAVGREGPPWQG